MSVGRYIWSARWVLPMDRAPIPDGIVQVDDGWIVAVGKRTREEATVSETHFPGAVLLPGLVNAYSPTHLTALRDRLSTPAGDAVTRQRVLEEETRGWRTEEVERSVAAGLQEMLAAGITTLGHVSVVPPLGPFLRSPQRAVLFHEVGAIRREQVEPAMDRAEEWLAMLKERVQGIGAHGRISPGIALGSLCGISEELLRRVLVFAARHKVPLSVRAAETEAEVTFLREGGGPLGAWLRERHALEPTWRVPGVSPVVYADRFGLLRPSALVVHANYLSETDVRRLAASGATVVYCPSAHRLLSHQTHPAGRLLRTGARLALGTENLAANARLDLLAEVRCAARAFPSVPPQEWLRAITLTPARALGLQGQVGSLTPGKAADLVAVALEDPDARNPWSALVQGSSRVLATVIQGAVSWTRGAAP